jgi:hypothetical protein
MAQKQDDAPLYIALGLLGMAAFVGVSGTLAGNKEQLKDAVKEPSEGGKIGYDPTPPPGGLVANAVRRKGRVGKKRRRGNVVRKDAVITKSQAFKSGMGASRRKKNKGTIGSGTLNAGGTVGMIGGCGCGPKGKR